jgi:hypothetical protein
MSEPVGEALDRRRANWDGAVARARVRFRVDDLAGLAADAARAQVEGAGGEFVTDDRPIAAKLDSNRVIATVSGGHVVAVRIG